MSLDISCYDNVVGLSQTDCNCYDANTGVESLSGLYLDEAQGLNLRAVNDMEDCTYGTLWERMQKAMNKGITYFIADTNAKLIKNYSLRKQKFKGSIGTSKYNGNLSILKTYAGVELFCSNVVGGVLKVKGVNTIFSATGTITLYIYDNNGTLHSTQTLNTIAGKVCTNTFASVVELPMHNDNLDNIEYFFVYEYSAANIPKSNQLSCGCGGDHYYFNAEKPDFTSKSTSKWKSWLMATGIQKDTLTFVDNITDMQFGNTTNGLILNIELGCNVSETICKDSLDFGGQDPFALTIAFAIQHKAAEYLANDILTSGDINRYTMLDNENLMASSVFHSDAYKESVEYVVSEAHIDLTDCLTCKETITKRGILS